MAAARMLNRAISTSKKFAVLETDKARLLYLMMLPWTDVEGRIEADATLIKGQIVTLLKYPPETIEKCLANLEAAGLIVLYEADGRRILQFTRFGDFQNLRKDREGASQFPALPADSGSTPGVLPLNISEFNIRESKYTEEFELFWKKWKGRWNGNEYVKVGKFEAAEVWQEMRGVDKLKAMKHAGKGGDKFTPNAAKWLELKRFDDYEKQQRIG